MSYHVDNSVFVYVLELSRESFANRLLHAFFGIEVLYSECVILYILTVKYHSWKFISQPLMSILRTSRLIFSKRFRVALSSCEQLFSWKKAIPSENLQCIFNVIGRPAWQYIGITFFEISKIFYTILLILTYLYFYSL